MILCDLSSHNANVFLELGWALRADKPFVLIKDDFTHHSFDLNQQYTFSYSHALKPTALRHDISKLADVIRRTLSDTERRYSLVQRIGISVSRGKSLDEEGFEEQILSDLQHKIANPQSHGRNLILPLNGFPWPELLRRGMTAMFAVKKSLSSSKLESGKHDWYQSLIQFWRTWGHFGGVKFKSV